MGRAPNTLKVPPYASFSPPRNLPSRCGATPLATPEFHHLGAVISTHATQPPLSLSQRVFNAERCIKNKGGGGGSSINILLFKH